MTTYNEVNTKTAEARLTEFFGTETTIFNIVEISAQTFHIGFQYKQGQAIFIGSTRMGGNSLSDEIQIFHNKTEITVHSANARKWMNEIKKHTWEYKINNQ